MGVWLRAADTLKGENSWRGNPSKRNTKSPFNLRTVRKVLARPQKRKELEGFYGEKTGSPVAAGRA